MQIKEMRIPLKTTVLKTSAMSLNFTTEDYNKLPEKSQETRLSL